MSALETVEPSISVGGIRQNPTQMIHDVRLGQEYILTDRGVPTARIIPFRPSCWIPAARVQALLGDPMARWAAELVDDRLCQTPRDTWES